MDRRLAVSIAIIQFFFAVTWTVYVVYLPQLVERSGIARSWVPWILVADQVVFAVVDVATGFWLDKVRARLARFGGWILAVTAISCVAFVLLPFIAVSPVLLLALIFVWAVSSSALRAPPWMLLSRHAATPGIPWLATLVLTGTALASAAAPYLGIALRGVDVRLPFIVSTLTLLVSVGALVLAERKAALSDKISEAPPAKAAPHQTILFFAALLAMAVGFQAHFSLNSAPQYLRFAAPGDLPWLMPAFWFGFNLAMLAASRGVRRFGAPALMALAAAAGAVAIVACVIAPGLATLAAAQFVAGGCWGVASVAAYTGAIALGRTGREGRFLGTLFAMFAVATLLRIAMVASGLAAAPQLKGFLPWLPETAWLLAGLLLLVSARPRAATRR